LGAIGGAGGITGSKAICDQARQIRNHGRTGRDGYKTLGWNRNLHTMQASFLLAKLPYLDELNDMKRAHAIRYNEQLKEVVKHVPQEQADRCHPYHLYSVLVDKRDELKKFLALHDIETLIHWPCGVHEHDFSTRADIELPNTRNITDNTLSLPCSPFLTQDEQDYIIQKIKSFY
jgi:dTDP-4-amino-4,6-dideoxygalactose transaminase